ncbi:MAG: GGDEF domain-containing protein [Gammaproteobacteria bacterium]|nr:GGDEF domain-containing protein [Gammaproteobacteria bacterium]
MINLTIFQKMLVTPVLGIILYTSYLFYIHIEHQHSSDSIEMIRDSYLPALSLVNDNIHIFENISIEFKDAVTAGEKLWVEENNIRKEKFEKNIKKIITYKSLVDTKVINQLHNSFSNFYDNSYKLSINLIENNDKYRHNNELIDNINMYFHDTELQLHNLKNNMQENFSASIDNIRSRMDHLVVVGIFMLIFLLILIALLSFVISLSTRRSLQGIIQPLMKMAQGQPDYTHRLPLNTKDELGELSHWFNVLSKKHEQDYKRIEKLSITDKLTQLYNRTMIDDILEKSFSRSQRYQEEISIILIDIDKFKEVNDTYGHQTGDHVLQKLANILQDNTRSSDSVGRWGGEEFIVITSNTGKSDIAIMAEKLRLTIESCDFDNVGKITASFGIANYESGDSVESLTRRADVCLYLAKKSGRNKVIDDNSIAKK